MRCFILYNPLAGGGQGLRRAEELSPLLQGRESEYRDIREIRDYGPFIRSLSPEDIIIICGGDGTLNRFVNKSASLSIKNPIYVYAAGSANDFIRDLGRSRDLSSFSLNDALSNLPVVTVKGRDYRFINGVSCGTEGSIGALRVLSGRAGQRSFEERLHAFNRLMFRYRPCSAEVSVDGVKRLYSRVWMAPTVNGRFLSGGLSPVPEQDRFGSEGKVSVLILHDCGPFRSMFFSPAVFRGSTEKIRSHIDVLQGHDVSVSFDRPAELQIDGESLRGISSYRVRSSAMIKNALPALSCITESAAMPLLGSL